MSAANEDIKFTIDTYGGLSNKTCDSVKVNLPKAYVSISKTTSNHLKVAIMFQKMFPENMGAIIHNNFIINQNNIVKFRFSVPKQLVFS